MLPAGGASCLNPEQQVKGFSLGDDTSLSCHFHIQWEWDSSQVGFNYIVIVLAISNFPERFFCLFHLIKNKDAPLIDVRLH